jgi:hypothetical protein
VNKEKKMTADLPVEQERAWGALYERIQALLSPVGQENPYGKADYWLIDDNWGSLQHKIEVQNLHLLKPDIVRSLQVLLEEFHGWEIVVAVHVPGTEKSWPPMGLIIRAQEIVDGLQRQYFPKEFQSYQYQGSRRGTDRD